MEEREKERGREGRKRQKSNSVDHPSDWQQHYISSAGTLAPSSKVKKLRSEGKRTKAIEKSWDCGDGLAGLTGIGMEPRAC